MISKCFANTYTKTSDSSTRYRVTEEEWACSSAPQHPDALSFLGCSASRVWRPSPAGVHSSAGAFTAGLTGTSVSEHAVWTSMWTTGYDAFADSADLTTFSIQSRKYRCPSETRPKTRPLFEESDQLYSCKKLPPIILSQSIPPPRCFQHSFLHPKDNLLSSYF